MKIRKQFFVFPPVMILAFYSASLGFVIPQIQQAYSLSYSAAGLFSTLQSVGMICAITLCFCIFSGLNKYRLILIGSVSMAVFLMLMSQNIMLFLLYAIFFLIGFAMNLPDTLSHSILADLSKEKTDKYISIMHALWAIIGMASPFFAMLIDSSYKTVFLIIGLVTMVCALIYAMGFIKEIKKPFVQNTDLMGSVKKLFLMMKHPGMPLFVIITFLCCCVQMPIMYFVRIYGQSISGVELHGAFALSSLFIGLFFGNIGFAVISHKVNSYKLIIVSSILAYVFFSSALIFENIIALCVFNLLGAVCMAPCIPIVCAKACEVANGDTAAASALIFVGIALSAFVAPPLIGAIGDVVGLRLAFLVNASVYLLVIALSIVLYRKFSIKRIQKQSI